MKPHADRGHICTPMDWLIVHSSREGPPGLALPIHAPPDREQGTRVPTLEDQEDSAGLGCAAYGLGAQGGGFGASLRPELSFLGYAGVCMLSDPHSRVQPSPYPILRISLPLPFFRVDRSTWGPLHPQHFPNHS